MLIALIILIVIAYPMYRYKKECDRKIKNNNEDRLERGA
jgi:hypothetical protein